MIVFHSEYFDSDPSEEKGQTQAQTKPAVVGPQSNTVTATDSDTVRVGHAQTNVDNLQPTRDL
jgi:hypothetical protein